MTIRKTKNIFIAGAISPSFISECISNHSEKLGIGGHSIFLGQVRADSFDGDRVEAIEYTAYNELALAQMDLIREETFARYPLTCMHVYQSIGTVKAGEICLFVFTSSAHRAAAISACQRVVERFKAEVAVWGKEVFNDGSHLWKKNT